MAASPLKSRARGQARAGGQGIIDPMRLRSGDQFDRYTIEELLGEGGMGVVYRATDVKLERKVALKVLRSTKSDADTQGRAVARMLREARAAASLSHPNAVSIYDVGEHEGVPYLAMEYIEGTSLRRLIGGDIPLAARLRWLGDIAKALSAAHRAGLVHRDVKPENIRIRDDGVLKVLDFGIARHLQLTGGEGDRPSRPISTLSEQSTLIGTPAYMAPEQIRGDPIDGRADQFSWGVLAYELFAGKLPFGAGRDAVGMLASVLTEKEPPLTDAPEVVAAIVHRTLSKSPDDRFASMNELVEELADASGGIVEIEPSPASGLSPLSGPGPTSGPRSTGPRRHTTPPARPRNVTSTGGSTLAASSLPRRPRWHFLVAGVGVLALAAIVVTTRRAEAPSSGASVPSISSTSAVAPQAVPTPITETAPPTTRVPEALAAYREGLQAFRDASWLVAHDAYERAIKLDPTFAAAYLRLAMTSRYLGTAVETRESFQKAMQLRAQLGERDQALLEALEPRLFRQPFDALESARRLELLAARFPGDAEIANLLNSADPRQPPAAELELADRCIAIDPFYADCWQSRALALRRMRRKDEALAALDQCLAVSAAAHDCLGDRALLHMMEGRCDKLEEDARSLTVRVPAMPRGYEYLARALYARGRPIAAVRSALTQSWSRQPQATREVVVLEEEAHLAVVSGRFDEAERFALDLLKKQEHTSGQDDHTQPALLLIKIYEETGRLKEAGAVAEATRHGLDVWVRSLQATVMSDKAMELLAVSRRAGLVTPSAFEAERAAWLREVEKEYPGTAPGAEWFVAYAQVASTPEEARAALDRMPDPRVVAPFVPLGLEWISVMGRLYWLAGRYDDALPYLREVTRDCCTLKVPFRNTLASYQLGEVLSAKGDKEGACGAYRVVLDRWGASKASVTAKEAAARVKALGCGK